ncbi:MAG: arylesterase [Gemmatimonadaceae bacterium]
MPPGADIGAATATALRPSGRSPVQTPDARRTLLFVGTSITAGLGLDPDSAYPAIIQRKLDSAQLNINVVNAGVSGETSAGARRRIDWLLRAPADFIVIETGANDGLRAQDIDSTRRNIRSILAEAHRRRPEAQLFLVQMRAPPNLGQSYTARFAAMFPMLAGEGGATLVPFLLDGVAGQTELNQADGIHPNEKGERIVADNVWRSLRPAVTAGR